MVAEKNTAAQTPMQEFVISRTFDAPRELVFKACSEPAHMQHWFAPKGFTSHVAKMDLRPGGMYHYCMRSPDGHEMWGKCIYREVVPPERLVFLQSFSNAKGEITAHPMSPTWPREMLSTMLFEEKNGKTTLTIKWIPYNASDAEIKTFEDGRKGMHGGWTGTLDQLTAYLAKIQA